MEVWEWEHLTGRIYLLCGSDPVCISEVRTGCRRWIWPLGNDLPRIFGCLGGRVFRTYWDTRIEGIEIYPVNIDSYHSCFYNIIHVADAFDHVQTEVQPGQFDLIILGDVLEHFTKERALVRRPVLKNPASFC